MSDDQDSPTPGPGDVPPPSPDFGAPPPPPASPPPSQDFVDESGASLWVRALYMVLFGAIAYVVVAVIFVVSIVQLVVFLIAGKPNAELRHFSREAVTYLGVILTFLVFLEDTKPYPFSSFSKEADKDDREDNGRS